jgi:hypothetical protein
MSIIIITYIFFSIYKFFNECVLAFELNFLSVSYAATTRYAVFVHLSLPQH